MTKKSKEKEIDARDVKSVSNNQEIYYDVDAFWDAVFHTLRVLIVCVTIIILVWFILSNGCCSCPEPEPAYPVQWAMISIW